MEQDIKKIQDSPEEDARDFNTILSASPAIKAVIKTAQKVALADVNVLITGESGTGKNVLAKAIHQASQRKSGPFVALNCMAMPDTLIESELFGHEKGAFTDAHALKRGSFELADHGTLFLDEIGDMSGPAQGKILQAIEDRKFHRLGSEKTIDTDTRLISATNRDLKKKMEEGGFREDLYYRLREVSLYLSPLRERKEDIPLLVQHFVRLYAKEFKKPNLKISDVVMSYLSQYPWPGNVRELKNVIKSAVVLCPQDTLWLEHFPFEMQMKTSKDLAGGVSDFSLDAILKRHVEAALLHFEWNKKKAAAALGISRPRLDRYLSKFQIKRDR